MSLLVSEEPCGCWVELRDGEHVQHRCEEHKTTDHAAAVEEVRARKMLLMDCCGAHKKFTLTCRECRYVRALETDRATLLRAYEEEHDRAERLALRVRDVFTELATLRVQHAALARMKFTADQVVVFASGQGHTHWEEGDPACPACEFWRRMAEETS